MWWADSPDVEGFSAAGDSFDDVRHQARDGVAFFIGEPVAIVEEGLPTSQLERGLIKSVRIHLSGTFTGSMLRGADTVFEESVEATTIGEAPALA